MPLIIGTAGHIDHGKTSLIRALTGQDTDRLKEEKERGISIDLGFAYLDADGERAGIVDVPGHERFIRNMLAGAHGIDLVLFTVAADDGVMPQTEEHLDILHLLGVRRGIFVITKTDLVDAARVAAVREEIEILTLDTTLEGAPVVPVSTLTGAGLDAIRPAAKRPIASHTRVRFHLGTAEVMGKLVLLGGHEELPPRSAGWAQLVLVEPVLAMRGDRFILREETARRTLGGGVVVNPFADRHRRAEAGLEERLEMLRGGEPPAAARAFLGLTADFAG